ncbi:hypothetical protein ACWPM1_13155 [Tsuneonella sp. HG249]
MTASPAIVKHAYWDIDNDRPQAIALACLVLVLLLQVELVFSKSVNWDEFYHFSEIHQFRLGRWSPTLQTPYVYLFSWVPALPGDTIDHIQLVRLLILPFEMVTLASIYFMAQRLVPRDTALFCTLLFATGGYVFLHAFAIRADMIAAAFLSLALWLVMAGELRIREMAIGALLLVLAFVATIKSAVWFPAFLAALLYRLGPLDGKRLRSTLLGLCAVAAGVIAVAAASGVGVIVYALNSARWMFSAGLFPQGRFFLSQIASAPILSVIIAYAVWMGLKEARTSRRLLLFGLLAPVVSVVAYRNAFPYFFAFILPPVIVGAAPAANLAVRRYGLSLLSLLLLGNAVVLSLREDRRVLVSQQVILDGVREIFPKPVAYIDDSGMVGDYPRAVARFASGWAIAESRQRGELVYSEALDREAVPLLVANSPALLAPFRPAVRGDRLLGADSKTLRSNYLQHWGKVYVAGKKVRPGASVLEIKVPGPYTVEDDAIVVDGTSYRVGEVVSLTRGAHSAATSSASTGSTLRWGKRLKVPREPWPTGRYYTDY